MRQPLPSRMIRDTTDPEGYRAKYNAHSDAMRVLLGLTPTAKLPPNGMPPRDIQGFTVYVAPLGPSRIDGRGRRAAHRVRAICPICTANISAGRVHQHMRIHEAPNKE